MRRAAGLARVRGALRCAAAPAVVLCALMVGACQTLAPPVEPPTAPRPLPGAVPGAHTGNTPPTTPSIAPGTAAGPPPPSPGAPAPIPPPAGTAAAAAAGAVRYERESGAPPLAIADADWLAAWPAWLASCRALTAERNPHHGAWDGVCTEAIFVAPSRGSQVRDFFARTMDRYRVLALDAADDADALVAAGLAAGPGTHDTGLMTGYYEPVLEGSRVRRAGFTVPLYRAPATAVSATRGELAASGQLRGNELLWVGDPVDAFFLEVQGSGRIHLTDGGWVRVAYAASNGLAYRSIGRWLADRGELPLRQVSQRAIREWADAHPQRVRELLEQNPRVVFFREVPMGNPETGPVGSLGVALTPGISVAIDPHFLPLGAPLLLETRAPISDAPLARLALAQDTGGAIRGPLRVDWFWGVGPGAGDIAGHQNAPGTVRLLVPRGIAPDALL